jgi:hypothetical protein
MKDINVVIDGIRYIPDPNCAETVLFYFMYSNLAFDRLYGTTLDEVLAHADELALNISGSSGMLCPALLLQGQREIRRIGPIASAPTIDDQGVFDRDLWETGKKKWRSILEKDADVVRLVKLNTKQVEPVSYISIIVDLKNCLVFAREELSNLKAEFTALNEEHAKIVSKIKDVDKTAGTLMSSIEEDNILLRDCHNALRSHNASQREILLYKLRKRIGNEL